MNSQFSFKAELILILVTLIAASGWIFSKEALAGMPPLFFIALRFFIGGVALLLIGKKYFRGVLWSDVKPLIFIGSIMGIGMLFWVIGLNQTSNLGVGAFITCLGVVFVPVIGKLFFNDHPPLTIWIALPIAVVGLIFLVLANGLNLETSHLYFLITAISVAFQLNLLSRFLASMNALVITSIQLTTAGVLLFIVSLVFEGAPQSISSHVIGWLLASALIATSLRYFLQMYAMGMTPVSHSAVIMNLEPVWAAIFATIWFKETMTIGQSFGCGLIFLAMLVSRWPQIKVLFKPK